MKLIHIEADLTDPQAWELAQFIKRVRFSQFRDLTDCGYSRVERENQAFRMRDALYTIGAALREAGYAPR